MYNQTFINYYGKKNIHKHSFLEQNPFKQILVLSWPCSESLSVGFNEQSNTALNHILLRHKIYTIWQKK